jgi:transcription termination/antitermination protein NusG
MKVATLLRCKGYEEFLPTYPNRRHWSDRIKVVEQPLFPGYVFCRIREESVGLVRATSGVIRIVGMAGKASPIPDEQIDSVRQVVHSGIGVYPFSSLAIGQRVKVVKGPLAGIAGIIVRVKKCSRLLISVDLIMKSIAVEVDLSDLEMLISPMPEYSTSAI